MTNPAALARPWLAELRKHLVAGKQILLHGNVSDLYLLDSKHVRLRELLQHHLLDDGFEVVGSYDVVDELEWQNADTMLPRIRSYCAHEFPTRALLLSPERVSKLLDNVRHILGQSDVRAGFVFEYSDKIFGDPIHQQPAERAQVVLLQKAIQLAAFVQGRRNALIILATSLSNIPPWLHQENPSLALVHLPPPSREERGDFLRRYRMGFYEGEALDPICLESRAEEFADLTDGLTTADLDGIRRTSLDRRIPIDSAKAVVDFFKHGEPVQNAWEKLSLDEIRNARATIEERVMGQERAVSAVVDMLMAARMGISMTPTIGANARPRGVFFFIGPTGVGKTELAKALAELVFRDVHALKRFDMSEYGEEHAAQKLIGAPPGYVGYSEGGQLTNFVQRHPFSVLLFDEIDKAAPDVMNMFLQVLEDGRLTDGQGRTTYFSETVVVFTSNLGAGKFSKVEIRDDFPSYESLQATFRQAIDEELRPEIRNRLGDNIAVFDVLRPQHVRAIAAKLLGALTDSARVRYGLHLRFEEGIFGMVQALMQVPSNSSLGGRRIKTLLESIVERPLNRHVLLCPPAAGEELLVSVADDAKSILINGTAPGMPS